MSRNEIRRITCPECGEVATVDHSFLYHDVEQRLMLYMVKEEETFREAVEKIRVFDAGRDDRVIELLKVFFQNRIMSEQPQLGQDLIVDEKWAMEVIKAVSVPGNRS